jgi:hypothetical protein
MISPCMGAYNEIMYEKMGLKIKPAGFFELPRIIPQHRGFCQVVLVLIIQDIYNYFSC